MQERLPHDWHMTSLPAGRPDGSGAKLDLSVLRNDVGFQVHITKRAIWNVLRLRRRRDIPREPSGFYASLIVIGANPGISKAQLADALFIDPPNLSQILSRLTEANLLARESDPTDQRRHLLTLSDDGRARLKDAVAFNASQRSFFSKALQPEEIEQLTSLLRKLQEFLKDETGRNKQPDG